MDRITRTLRTRVSAENAKPAVTPVYQSSAFEADSPFFYSRKSNPNVVELEDATRALEGASYAVAFSTGMAAVRACLDLLRPGDLLVANKHCYGCSLKLFQLFCERMQMRLAIVDLSSSEGINSIPTDARMVFFETPTNPFLHTVSIRAVANRAKAQPRECLVVVDNTWATSLYQQPLNHGASISLHSATKYLSGHSDVMGGITLTERADLHASLLETRFYSGAVLDPHSAWLLRRSLQTLQIRVDFQQRQARSIKAVLETLPQVTEVMYPVVDGEQLTGYAGLLFFRLRPDLVDRYSDLLRMLKLFGTGTGMACVTSMIAQPYSGSHASLTDAEKVNMGLDRGLIRLSLGLEALDDLSSDLRSALAQIDRA